MDFIDPIIIRTEFNNETQWEELCEMVKTPNTEYGIEAYIEFLNDPRLNGLNSNQVFDKLVAEFIYDFDFYFVADKITFSEAGFPLLCVKIPDEHSPEEGSFRVIPNAIWAVESNLRICNMDFTEFSQNTDEAGIFKGF